MSNRLCYDVRCYNTSVVFFDSLMKQFEECDAKTYICNEATAKQLDSSIKKLRLRSGDWIVYNPDPKRLESLVFTKHYGWFSMKCACDEMKISINTHWNILPIRDLSSISVKNPDDGQHATGGSATLSHDDVLLVSSSRIDGFVEKRTKVIVVPLLETITRVKQEYAGMTLRQISCEIYGYFKAEYYDEQRLMVDLFNVFREEFCSICQVEAVGIQELYLCEFNNTFLYGGDRSKPDRLPEAIKRMIDVYMVPQSLLVGSKQKTYGNIPWGISTDEEQKNIPGEKIYSLEPFMFFKTDTHGSKGQHLTDMIIFPKMVIDGERYASGSSMAFRPIPSTKGCDIIFRGDLFYDISIMEWIILKDMYYALYINKLEEGTEVLLINRNLPLPPEEMRVRPKFINAIKAAILLVENSYVQRLQA